MVWSCRSLSPLLYSHNSQGTANELQGEESFENISVLQEISKYVVARRRPCKSDSYSVLLPDLKRLHSRITLSNTLNGDGTEFRVG